MGYGDVACHGNPWLKTPQLDRLHAESVCLEDFHTDPVCTPTRAALLTGRYSVRTGAWTITEGRQLLHPDEFTMAQAFAASGYRTAMFGKWHLGDPYPYAPMYRGFQEVVAHRAGGVDEIGNPTGNHYFDDTYYRNGNPEKFHGYCTDVWFDETMRFIGEKPNSPEKQPFFVYLPLNAMHSPFGVTDAYADPYRTQGHPEERARFYGMIANLDYNLGRLLIRLRELGLERDTLLIVMGDNGTAAKLPTNGTEPALFNAGMRGEKGSVYEGGHRLCCWARWPAGFRGGRQVGGLTAHFDLMPTLVDLCGLNVPHSLHFDGRSLRPLLEHDHPNWPDRTLVVSREPANITSTARAPFAVLTESWRLVNRELYAIKSDPGQQHDVAADHPDVVNRLTTAYREWRKDVSHEHPQEARFLVGDSHENPTRFTARDWFPDEGRAIWQTAQLADSDLFAQGFWLIDITQPGRYAVRLSRFPEDDPHPIGANEARLIINDQKQTQVTSPDASSVTFTLDLPAGPARLKTALREARSGKERGAYFVQVQLLDASATAGKP